MVNRLSFVTAVSALIVASAALVACDDPFIDPYVNEGRYFTVWGYIDATASQQALRVIPVTRTATGARAPVAEDLDARVYTTEVASGIVTEWSPTVVELEDGSFAHIFTTGARFRPGYHYTLEVRRSDGRSARADTWVPDYNPFQSIEPGEVFTDSTGHIKQRVILKGIDSPWKFVATYLAEGGTNKVVSWIDYDRVGSLGADGDWSLELDLTADMVVHKEAFRKAATSGDFHGEDGLNTRFALSSIGLRIYLADDGWDIPDGEIDPELLSRPDVLTNVENGYGYWGSVYLIENKWGVAPELSVALGWDPTY